MLGELPAGCFGLRETGSVAQPGRMTAPLRRAMHGLRPGLTG